MKQQIGRLRVDTSRISKTQMIQIDSIFPSIQKHVILNFIIVMKSTILLLFLLTTLLATRQFHAAVEPSHDAVFNLPCCNSYGGVLCGYLFKTCCLGPCNNWIVAQTCRGQSLDLRPEHCGNSCLNQCGIMGGVICGTSILRDQCCQPQFCQGLTSLTRTCLPGTNIPLGNCAPNTPTV